MGFAGDGSLIGSTSLFATESAVGAVRKMEFLGNLKAAFSLRDTGIDCDRGQKLNRHFFHFCHLQLVEVMDCPHGGPMQGSRFASATPE